MGMVDYGEIFEKAEVGIALNDPETGTVGTVNQRYADLFGYSRSELAEMRIEEISAESPRFDQAAAMEKIEQALAGERKQFDWYFERADGSRFWGEVVLKRMAVGGEDRLVAFVRDVTERREYERELELKNQRLERFADILSHDLRNPLNVATGELATAREERDDDHLEAVGSALDRMDALIDDMQDLARVGTEASGDDAVDLPTVAGACWRMVDTADATLEIQTEATIRADEGRSRQLLENLFRNAVEHGGDDVTVTVGDLPDGFYVADDGPGIQEADTDVVFKPGYSTSEAGRGLGLSIVSDVAADLGWTVTASQSDAGGACFEFTDVERHS